MNTNPAFIVALAAAPPSGRAFVNLIAASAAIAGFLFGFDTAVVNGGLVGLKADMHLGDAQVEIATSALLVGCVVGSAVSGLLADRFGRRQDRVSSNSGHVRPPERDVSEQLTPVSRLG